MFCCKDYLLHIILDIRAKIDQEYKRQDIENPESCITSMNDLLKLYSVPHPNYALLQIAMAQPTPWFLVIYSLENPATTFILSLITNFISLLRAMILTLLDLFVYITQHCTQCNPIYKGQSLFYHFGAQIPLVGCGIWILQELFRSAHPRNVEVIMPQWVNSLQCVTRDENGMVD